MLLDYMGYLPSWTTKVQELDLGNRDPKKQMEEVFKHYVGVYEKDFCEKVTDEAPFRALIAFLFDIWKELGISIDYNKKELTNHPEITGDLKARFECHTGYVQNGMETTAKSKKEFNDVREAVAMVFTVFIILLSLYMSQRSKNPPSFARCDSYYHQPRGNGTS